MSEDTDNDARLAAQSEPVVPMLDTSYHARRRAQRMADPELRAEYELFRAVVARERLDDVEGSSHA